MLAGKNCEVHQLPKNESEPIEKLCINRQIEKTPTSSHQ